MTRRSILCVAVVLLWIGPLAMRAPAQGPSVTGGTTVMAQIQSPQAKQADPNEQIRILLDKMETMQIKIETLQETWNKASQKLQAISEMQGDRVVPSILGNMALDEAKQSGPTGTGKLANATDQTRGEVFKDYFMRSVQGHLVIDNDRDHPCYVEVNGVAHLVRPRTREDLEANRSACILVPYGKVKTQLFYAVPVNDDAGKFVRWEQGTSIDPEPRTWGDQKSGKWKVVVGKDGKQRLMLPLRIPR